MELRPEQLQAAKTFCYRSFDLWVVCPLQSIIDEQIAEIWQALRLRLPTCQMESWARPNFSFYFAQSKKYRLVGCFHVDFGAKILTISSFSFLKRALICNNMLTVNIFGLCPLRNLICRFKVSIESFRFSKRSITFRVLKLVSINVAFKHRFAPPVKYLRIVWVASGAQARY